MKPLEVIIIGAGMYVCGKGTEGYGTILPSVFEAWRAGMVNKIHIAAASHSGAEQARRKAAELKAIMGVDPEITYYPTGQDDDLAYQKAVAAAKGPAAALISVPDHLHFKIAAYCIEHNLHIQVVKPLVPTIKENKLLIALQKKHNIYGAVEFHKRFDEANLKLRELIQDKALGKLLNFRINFSQRKIIPASTFRSWIDHTDIFQYLGVHYVDLIYFLTGARPTRLMSIGQKKHLLSRGIDTYDSIQTVIDWQYQESNFISSHLSAWIDPNNSSAMSDQRIEVIGTTGRYQSNQKSRGITLTTDDRGVEEINPYFSQFYYDISCKFKRIQGYGPKSIIQFLQDAGDVIDGRATPAALTGLRATFATSLIIATVLEASRQSLQSDNTWIPIEATLDET